MEFNLLETVSSFFNKDVISKTASSLGESENSVQKAITGVIPSLLTAILNKVGSGDNPIAVNNLLDMAKQASGSGILNNISGSSMSNLIGMTGNIFGSKIGSVSNAIANFAGIKPSSASSLLNMAAPVTLAAIGKQAIQNNLNANGLVSMLLSQKEKILAAIPSGLGLASVLGIGSLSDIGSRAYEATTGVVRESRKKSGWLVPALLVVGAIGLVMFLSRRGSREHLSSRLHKDTTATIIAPPKNPAVSTATIKVKLPDGVELDAFRGGIEDQLFIYLKDPNSKVSNDIWFDFDNLNFETGSAKITIESQKQVNNIAAILKAFPKLKIKIGGYTDRTGDAAANKKLSQERANAVVAALKASGTKSSQLVGAEGYGTEFAKVPANASEQEREKDRRVAISVRAK